MPHHMDELEAHFEAMQRRDDLAVADELIAELRTALGIERACLEASEALVRGMTSLNLKKEEEARSWRSVAERLETEMQELLAVCESEIGAQTSNSEHSDERLAAYAEGALRVAKGIAARIKQGAAAR